MRESRISSDPDVSKRKSPNGVNKSLETIWYAAQWAIWKWAHNVMKNIQQRRF